MNDEELKELFSAFDDVSASESLKSSTLDFIMAAAPAAPLGSEAQPPAEAAAPQQSTPVVTAARGKKRAASKWRAFRVAAVAACLTLTLTGGVAYATPASHVVLVQGDAVIELDVNCFGITISASANDAGQQLLSESGTLNVPYEDSVARVSDSMRASNPTVPVEVTMKSGSSSKTLSTQAVEEQPEDRSSAQPAPAAERTPDMQAATPATDQGSQDAPAPTDEQTVSWDTGSTVYPAPYVETVVEDPIAVPESTGGVTGSGQSESGTSSADEPSDSGDTGESDNPGTTDNPGKTDDSGSKDKPSDDSTVTPPEGYSGDTDTDVDDPTDPTKPDDPDDGDDSGQGTGDEPEKPIGYDDGDDENDFSDDKGSDDSKEPKPYDEQVINWTYEDEQ